MRPLQEPDIAWQELQNVPSLDALHSESYLNIALDHWLLAKYPLSPAVSGLLRKLGAAMEQNHGDPWLSDFIVSPSSEKANQLLQAAIMQNGKGRPDKSAAFARAARDLFVHKHNPAGIAMSEFELVYALHRGSHAQECVAEIPAFTAMLAGHKYRWLEIQLLLEDSSCQGMLTNFDSAGRLADKALERASASHFPILKLRAIGFQGSLHTVEGRLKESWRVNTVGLKLFWDGAYPGDRGFQFYSDLELAAERSGWWYLATVLQRETLHMLQEGDRIDVTAMAHFRLVGLLTSTGDLRGAQQELGRATELFTKLEDEEPRKLYQAYSEISLAAILLRHGELERASQHLQNAGSDFHQWRNFNINLRYLKTAAEIAHLKHDPEEKQLLTNIVSLGNSGFKSLWSGKDRWGWDHEIGPAYRRLLELEILEPHDASQALADWEYYRAKAGPRMDLQAGPITGNMRARGLLFKQMANLQHASLLTLAVFSNTVVAWLADDRGVREFHLNANPVTLSAELNQFYQLCSDRNSSLQKVNASGSRLYKLLIAPMETQLDPQRELFIEADGFLDRVPWPALVMTNGKYFGEASTITNTPGLFYAANRGSTTGPGTVVVAEPGAVDLQGNRYLPLPHAADEAERIAAMYSGSISLPGKKATLNAILAKLPSASTFHFAGHAANREYGGELLIHDETGGASLPASRVSSLTLRRMQLVVLSACSTAMSTQATSNDPDGLVSAFLQAGARTVVASNWDVDSKSTADMMVQFHTLVRHGQSISHALTQSRGSVLANPETRHPFYWAAFATFQPASLRIGEDR